MDAVLAHIRALPGCAGLEWKESTAQRQPFGKMKVRLKREIVTMGQPDVDPRAAVGRYVEPADWNDLIRDPDVAVIDTRNDYEVAIGTFEGAVDPKTNRSGHRRETEVRRRGACPDPRTRSRGCLPPAG